MGDPFKFAAPQPLRWVDVDAAGVVNHAIWFNLAEQARFEYFARLGVLRGDVPPFLLAATAARYERPGRVGMEIFVAVRTTRLGGRSLEMEYEIRRRAKPADERLAVITATLVWVDAQQKSCEIPAEARRAVAQFENIPEKSPSRAS